MKLHLLADFAPSLYREHGVTTAERVVMLTIDESSWDHVRRALKAHAEHNDKRILSGREPHLLEVTIETDYRSRTLSQNAWMWAAHTLEANILNGHRSSWTDRQGVLWREAESITPEMVHADYMERYAARGHVDVDPAFVHAVASMMETETGHVMGREVQPDGRVRLEVWKTSSYLNTAEFCALGRHIEDQLLSYGVGIGDVAEFLKLSRDLREYEKRVGKEALVPWEKLTDEQRLQRDPFRYYEELGTPIF